MVLGNTLSFICNLSVTVLHKVYFGFLSLTSTIKDIYAVIMEAPPKETVKNSNSQNTSARPGGPKVDVSQTDLNSNISQWIPVQRGSIQLVILISTCMNGCELIWSICKVQNKCWSSHCSLVTDANTVHLKTKIMNERLHYTFSKMQSTRITR